MESRKQEVFCLLLGERNLRGRSFWIGGTSLNSNNEAGGPPERNSKREETPQGHCNLKLETSLPYCSVVLQDVRRART